MDRMPLILGFDTSGPACAGALLRGDELLLQRAEPMARGQAERLVPFLEEILADAGAGWNDLAAIGVGIGPGNFTGIRIAVAAARGLVLGLGIPAVGVSGCEARACLAPGQKTGIEAPRERIYLCNPADPAEIPHLVTREAAGDVATGFAPDRLAGAICQVAATRWQANPPRPAPLYVRPADAAPMREAPPVLLDE
ncbi:tRNA (adenosine(37)-N6)-threonylcarbamoyltransferase complex dimerization subunit type 1 TsaB [Pontibaca methylaminivorans]|uniref:tRNA (adenosine(37)-N6)-threonylcarbamoyltransferase complex dimerization subunit type 1 TsaB n=1 Tax=Pontibaca methylaminivorans TaxID=515897 RepID=UPI003FA721EF